MSKIKKVNLLQRIISKYSTIISALYAWFFAGILGIVMITIWSTVIILGHPHTNTGSWLGYDIIAFGIIVCLCLYLLCHCFINLPIFILNWRKKDNKVWLLRYALPFSFIIAFLLRCLFAINYNTPENLLVSINFGIYCSIIIFAGISIHKIYYYRTNTTNFSKEIYNKKKKTITTTLYRSYALPFSFIIAFLLRYLFAINHNTPETLLASISFGIACSIIAFTNISIFKLYHYKINKTNFNLESYNKEKNKVLMVFSGILALCISFPFALHKYIPPYNIYDNY